MSSRCAASSTASEIAIPRLPGVSGNSLEDRATALRVAGRAGDDLRSPELDHRAPERLLLVRDLDHVDLALEADQLARERERAAPLAGAGLGREARAALLLVVERLRHGRVRLVAAGRADALVLVEDARLRSDGLFEPARPVERCRAPEAVHVEDLLRNRDLRLLADLLLDQRHREEGREVVRPDRLSGARVQHGLRRARHVGDDVVPTPGELRLLEQELRLLHAPSVIGSKRRWQGLLRCGRSWFRVRAETLTYRERAPSATHAASGVLARTGICSRRFRFCLRPKENQSSARSSADRHSARLAAMLLRSAAGS